MKSENIVMLIAIVLLLNSDYMPPIDGGQKKRGKGHSAPTSCDWGCCVTTLGAGRTYEGAAYPGG
jgi:hypothetical protein